MIHVAAIEGRLSIQELLITFFLFITAPVTAHFVAKVYLHTEIDPQKDLPKPSGRYGWSTFESAEDDPLPTGDPAAKAH